MPLYSTVQPYSRRVRCQAKAVRRRLVSLGVPASSPVIPAQAGIHCGRISAPAGAIYRIAQSAVPTGLRRWSTIVKDGRPANFSGPTIPSDARVLRLDHRGSCRGTYLRDQARQVGVHQSAQVRCHDLLRLREMAPLGLHQGRSDRHSSLPGIQTRSRSRRYRQDGYRCSPAIILVGEGADGASGKQPRAAYSGTRGIPRRDQPRQRGKDS
jgi:hypothetical protein